MPRRPDMPCADCGTLMWRSATSLPQGQARCLACRRARPTTPSCGTAHGYAGGCRCDACREAVKLAARRYIANYKQRHGHSPTQKYRPRKATTCTDCGGLVGGGWKGTPRCTPCGEIRRGNRRPRDWRRRAAEAKRIKAAAGTPANPRWPWVNGRCTYCDQDFTRRGQVSPYCSKQCNRRDNKPGSYITRSARRAIYERDRWICQLCGDPVDQTLDPADTWGPTLDHIVCRSWTDDPDHSPENLRLAHRWCNSVRGDETHYSAADLTLA